jgi:hypothetical protein
VVLVNLRALPLLLLPHHAELLLLLQGYQCHHPVGHAYKHPPNKLCTALTRPCSLVRSQQRPAAMRQEAVREEGTFIG